MHRRGSGASLTTGDDRPPIEPIGVRVPDASRMTGLGRSTIYELIASGDIEAAKVGRATVIMVERFDGKSESTAPSWLQGVRQINRARWQNRLTVFLKLFVVKGPKLGHFLDAGDNKYIYNNSLNTRYESLLRYQGI